MKLPDFTCIKEKLMSKKKLVIYGSVGLAGVLGSIAALLTLKRRKRHSHDEVVDKNFMQELYPDYEWNGVIEKSTCKTVMVKIPCSQEFLSDHPDAFLKVKDYIMALDKELSAKQVTILFDNKGQLLVYMIRRSK